MSDGGPLYEWLSVPYPTVVGFRSASGQGASDIGAAPGFVDQPGRDLALTPTSPAIDSADLGVAGAVSDDLDGVSPVDVAGSPGHRRRHAALRRPWCAGVPRRGRRGEGPDRHAHGDAGERNGSLVRHSLGRGFHGR